VVRLRARIEGPVGDCLEKGKLEEKVLYIVTTLGTLPKIDGVAGGLMADRGSVDSELALLYSKLHGMKFERAGTIHNPFFSIRDEPFHHPQFPVYLDLTPKVLIGEKGVIAYASWGSSDVTSGKSFGEQNLSADFIREGESGAIGTSYVQPRTCRFHTTNGRPP